MTEFMLELMAAHIALSLGVGLTTGEREALCGDLDMPDDYPVCSDYLR